MKSRLTRFFLILTWFHVIMISAQSTEERVFDVDSLRKDVEGYVRFLASDNLMGRDTGSEGLEKAAVFIEEVFKQNGVSAYFETYRDAFEAVGVKTQNIVGFIEGNDRELAKEFVILGAHYDHIGAAKKVGEDVVANGANDNAAGVAAVLAMSKYYAENKSNKRSVLFVLFGAEEKGLLGSEHLSNKLKNKGVDLYAMINFEMIGVPLKGRTYKAYITGYEISNMAEKLNKYAGQELIGFLPKAKEFNLFKRSDNYPFYKEFGVPCQTISTFDFTNYQYYHHVNDEVSKLDFVHMANIIYDCTTAIKKLVNTQTKEIQLNVSQK